jgi:hypothetical protein
MELGDYDDTERVERNQLDVVLDKLDDAFGELLAMLESGGLDHLDAAATVAVWQRFETFRNKLPLIDHRLIAAADAGDLATGYCCSTMTQFLVRVLQLSPGEAASRVRAAAAVGPRMSMLGERLEPLLPQLAALQRDGAVSTEKVAIVERAMHQLSRPGLDPEAVHTAEQLLADHGPILGPTELRRFALKVVDAADPDGPEPIDDQHQQDRRHLELKQRRDGMWWLQGRLTNTVGAQLNAILEPLAKPRTSSIEGEDGSATQIPDGRPSGQRLHDALDEVCGRILKTKDQLPSGTTPASVIVTINLEDLLAKAGLAETSDGTQLTADQLWRIADEAEIWPIILKPQRRSPGLRPDSTARFQRPNPSPDRPRPRLLLPRLHPPGRLVRPAPHHRLDPRRSDRPRQPHPALQIPPRPLPAERLELPHQLGRATRMDSALVDRPAATPSNQRPHPTHPHPATRPTTRATTITTSRMSAGRS